MNRILNIIKRKEIDVIILLTILVAGCSLFAPVDANDELWTFANSYKIFNGYKIYEDINIIVTPLFFYIAQIFLKIFGPTMLAFRIYNIVISTVILMLIYLIFKSLKVVRRRAIFYTVIITIIMGPMIASGANYNMIAIIPILISINLMIKQKENSMVLGILLFLTFMLKQNVFVFFALGILIYKFINRENMKNMIIDILKIYSISFIGIFIFLLYLHMDNNLHNFISYCILGIKEFGEKNIAINFTGAKCIYISIISIIFTFIIMYNKKINIDSRVIKNAKCLLSLGAPLLLIGYPIFNSYHSTLASIIIIVEFMYIIESTLIKDLQIKRKKEIIMYLIIMIIYIIYIYFYSIINISLIEKNEGKQYIINTNGVFYGTILEKETYEDIKEICNYIKEKENSDIDVKVLSYKANLYMVPLNKNQGVFDLALLGNLGKDGEEGLVNKIKNFEDTLILLQTDSEKIFWQESKMARKHIFDNYKKVGEIREYSIYYIK